MSCAEDGTHANTEMLHGGDVPEALEQDLCRCNCNLLPDIIGRCWSVGSGRSDYELFEQEAGLVDEFAAVRSEVLLEVSGDAVFVRGRRLDLGQRGEGIENHRSSTGLSAKLSRHVLRTTLRFAYHPHGWPPAPSTVTSTAHGCCPNCQSHAGKRKTRNRLLHTLLP
jgi:hypothetical protein